MAAVAVPVRRPASRAADRAVVPAGPWGCAVSPSGPSLPGTLSSGLLCFSHWLSIRSFFWTVSIQSYCTYLNIWDVNWGTCIECLNWLLQMVNKWSQGNIFWHIVYMSEHYRAETTGWNKTWSVALMLICYTVLTCRCKDVLVQLFSVRLNGLSRHILSFLSVPPNLSPTQIAIATKARRGEGKGQPHKR